MLPPCFVTACSPLPLAVSLDEMAIETERDILTTYLYNIYIIIIKSSWGQKNMFIILRYDAWEHALGSPKLPFFPDFSSKALSLWRA